MHATRLTARLGLLAAGLGVLIALQPPAARAAADRDQVVEREWNAWPVLVRETDPTTAPQWTSAGPLLFGHVMPENGGWETGLRPLWVQQDDAAGAFRAGYFLYPIFSYRAYPDATQWNVLELIRRTTPRPGAAAESHFARAHDFEIWPFWFSRQTGDPELSYHGLFPIAGTIKNKLGFDRASWVLFPLYAQTVKRGVRTTSVPWPIVRITGGAAHGFGIWPLFEVREKPGQWKQQTYLWPLGYNNTTYPAPGAPAGTPPKRQIGALPFYARHTGPGYRDENFLWPFFGYTDSTTPEKTFSLLPDNSHPPKLLHYHETRYFWPFLVQGRGDGRYVNRWGPVYTHSNVNGYDKRWYAWPVVRHAEWADRGLSISRTQVFYFLYWSERQQRISSHENQRDEGVASPASQRDGGVASPAYQRDGGSLPAVASGEGRVASPEAASASQRDGGVGRAGTPLPAGADGVRALPQAAPVARLTHVWPLYSAWDNGAGRRQFQLFSPLDVFFPGNEKIQAAWSPLFAIARREQTAPGQVRTSLLWNAVTWRRDDARQEREFHLGPLVSVARTGEQRRVAIGNGLVSFHRGPDSGWKVRWLDFAAKARSSAPLPR